MSHYLFFRNAINKQKLSQSYLLLGIDNNEKQKFVLWLSKILNCDNNKYSNYQEPCEKCTNCNWLNQNQHPEIPIIIDILDGKKEIVIEQIENLKNKISHSSKFHRIIYFPNAEQKYLNKTATNSLLKYIEEAPSMTIFLFCAKNIDDILPTIVSRSQSIYIANKNEITKYIIDEYTDNLLNNILSKRLNYYQVTAFIDDIENVKLENIIDYCSYKICNNSNNSYIYRDIIHKAELAQQKINSFCNKKLIIEELLFEITSSY